MVAMTLGQFVSRRRAALGLSQRELARQVHVSNSTIFRIENENNYTFSPNILRAVAKALHCDFNYLLSLNKQIDDEPEIRMIQRAAKKMSPEMKQDMMEILKRSFKMAFDEAGEDEAI